MPKMMFTINRNGEDFGPYDEAQVVEFIEHGKLISSDLAWCEGMEKWQPLGALPGFEGFFRARPRLIVPKAGGPQYVRSRYQQAAPSISAFTPSPSAHIPALLITLCILTILGSIFGIIRGLLYNSIAEFADAATYGRGIWYILFNAGTLAGAIIMLCRATMGLYLYSLSQIAYITLVLFTTYTTYGEGKIGSALSPIIGAFFWLPSLVFLVLYWLPATRSGLK